MDFSEVNDMESLKDSITKSKNLSMFTYFVNVYDCIEKDKWRFRNVKKQSFRFGKEDARYIERVNIEIYRDKIDLHCIAEGAKHHRVSLDSNKNYGIESCILCALGEWHSYYTN